jgi:hypothetical protein
VALGRARRDDLRIARDLRLESGHRRGYPMRRRAAGRVPTFLGNQETSWWTRAPRAAALRALDGRSGRLRSLRGHAHGPELDAVGVVALTRSTHRARS